MSYEIAVQSVVFGALSNDSALGALVVGVYDSVDQRTDYPYVTIGEDVHNEWDTGSTIGSSASIAIHSWSRARGKKETKQIQAAIYDALHRADLTIDGFNIDTIEWESSQSFVDADGLTRHGVQIFRILIERV
jgi:hypothetical protein